MARLIDADAVIRDLTAMKRVYDGIDLDGMIKGLEEQPTVEAVPVVHAGWEDKYGWAYANPIYRCSHCQKNALWALGSNELGNPNPAQVLSYYCPNCGAKMDGGGDGEGC